MQKVRLAATIGWGFPTWTEHDEAALLSSSGIRRAQLFRNPARPFAPSETRRFLADFGIEVVSIHGLFGDVYDPSNVEESARSRAAEGLAREAEVCLELGGRLVVVHPGDANIGQETRNPARIMALKRSAEHLAEAGRRLAVVFALENLQRGQMGDDMAMLRRIVDEIDSPQLGLNYDCGHANLTDGVVRVLEQCGPRIVATHIHDNSGRADDHWVPGTGTVDMEAVCRGLARFGYRGDFVLELLETTEAVRKKCTPEWQQRLARWLALANGLDS